MSLATVGPVALVGAGKMGLALARGWLASGLAPGSLILVDPAPTQLTVDFARAEGVELRAELNDLSPRVLVLAVKPQIINPVMQQVRGVTSGGALVISIAAGVTLGALAAGLDTRRIVRSMPNTPAQVGKGITGAVSGPGVSADDRALAEELLSAAGAVVWFADEADLDAVTAVSGSGPAYVFLLVEALAGAAEEQGLDPDQAMQLARETVIGAAALMDADPTPASILRQNVTSPNGTTAAALAVLMAESGLKSLIARAVAEARRRSEELGRSN